MWRAFLLLPLTLISGLGWAQDIQMLNPIAGDRGYVVTESSDILKPNVTIFKLYSSYARNTVMLRSLNTGMQNGLIENLTSFDLLATRSFLGLVDFSIAIPYGFSSGTKGLGSGLNELIVQQNDGSGLNNIRISQKIRILDRGSSKGFGLAATILQSIPVQNEQGLSLSSLGFVNPKLVLSWRLGGFDASVNIGFRYRFDGITPKAITEGSRATDGCPIVNIAADSCSNPLKRGHAIYYSMGIGYRLRDSVQLLADIYGRYFYEQRADNPLELLLAARLEPSSEYFATIGVGRGLLDSVGASELRLVAGIGVRQEPLRDSDEDGIEDARDMCRYVREDLDGFEDLDGCPELDNDRDGLEDSSDACISRAEDLDGFEDSDGCPELDNDRDGLEDLRDFCPLAPEDFDGVEDADGCPDEEVLVEPPSKHKKGKLISSGKAFFFDKATHQLLEQSTAAISAIIKALKTDPKILKISIEVHIDDSHGGAEALLITEKRARAIYDALCERGIAADRIVYKGFGAEQPISAGASEDSRAMNRRVNIRIVEYGD